MGTPFRPAQHELARVPCWAAAAGRSRQTTRVLRFQCHVDKSNSGIMQKLAAAPVPKTSDSPRTLFAEPRNAAHRGWGVLHFLNGMQSGFEWLESRREHLGYSGVVALILSLAALAATYAIPSLRVQAPGTFFIMSVVFSALYGGIVPGLLSAGLSLFLLNTIVAPMRSE